MKSTELNARLDELNFVCSDSFHELDELNALGNILCRRLTEEMNDSRIIRSNVQIILCKKLLAWIQKRISLFEQINKTFENIDLIEGELKSE